LQELYHGDSNVEIIQNPGWRDDFKFLHELCKAFQFHKVKKLIPQNRLVGFVIKRIFYLQKLFSYHGILPIITNGESCLLCTKLIGIPELFTCWYRTFCFPTGEILWLYLLSLLLKDGKKPGFLTKSTQNLHMEICWKQLLKLM